MTVLYAAGAAALGVLTAVGHSVIGERSIFGPLYRGEQRGLLAKPRVRDVIRGVFHLPSVAWAVMGLAVLAARLSGGDVVVTAAAATIFAVSGLANFTALRTPHFGGVMILCAAGLTLADWRFG
jgi:hypothetical protein